MQRKQPHPQQHLRQQLLFSLTPPTEPLLQQQCLWQQLLLSLTPPTEPLFWQQCLWLFSLSPPTESFSPRQQQQQQHLRQQLLFSLTPPTAPLFRQQGLQHDCDTKLGNVMPPTIPLLQHIRSTSKKDVMGFSSHDIL